MTAVRTMAWGTVALVAAVVWLPRPVSGQPPVNLTPAVPDLLQDLPRYQIGSFTAVNPYRADQERKQIAQLAQQYVKATKDDEKKDIRKKLSDTIGKQFDQLAEQQQKELADLEKQVADLRALLKKRHDARESIIDRRLEQVIQDAEGLGWSNHSAAPRGAVYPVPQNDFGQPKR